MAHCWRQVITKQDERGHKLEPYEDAIIEVPEEHMGQVVELMGTRKGQMQEMASGVEGGSRVTYTIPTRGLLGAPVMGSDRKQGQGVDHKLRVLHVGVVDAYAMGANKRRGQDMSMGLAGCIRYEQT